MSLLRLLTAGKSLVGLRRTEGRYHLPGEKSLPQFGPKKNPFRATVFPEKPESEPSQAQPKSGEEAGPTPNKDSKPVLHAAGGAGPGEAISVPSNAAVAESKRDLETERSRPTKSLGLKALFLWRRAKSPRLLPGLARPMVQGELSLDTVRVVRNDLSESDLEVVRREPLKSRARDDERRATVPVQSGEVGCGGANEAQLSGVAKF